MNIASGFSLSRRQALAVTTAWVMAGVTLYLLWPLTAPALFPLSIAAPLIWTTAAGRGLAARPGPVIIALLLANALLLLNASWSLNRAMAYRDVSALALYTLVLHLTINMLRSVEAHALRAMGIGLCAGVGLASFVLCFEVWSEQWLGRFLLTNLPGLRADLTHVIVRDGHVVHLQAFLLNRNMTALAALFWPAALILFCLGCSRRLRALLGLALVAALAGILGSEHETSKIALLGSAAAFGCYWLAPRLTMRLAVAGWVVATLFVVPLSLQAHASQLHLASWLPQSARHRIVLWRHAAEQVGKAPILGVGVATPRVLHEPNVLNAQRAPGSQLPSTTALHSHNAYLQVWYEAGAIGALVAFGLGLCILGSLKSAAPESRPALFAAFVCCALLASSSFSLWAPWFLATLAFAGVFSVLGRELCLASLPER